MLPFSKEGEETIMTIELLMLLSEIIDKMNIRSELENLEFTEGNMEELGTKVLVLVGCNLHKSKDEFYSFVMEYYGIDIEEAKKKQLIDLWNDLKGQINIKDFLK